VYELVSGLTTFERNLTFCRKAPFYWGGCKVVEFYNLLFITTACRFSVYSIGALHKPATIETIRIIRLGGARDDAVQRCIRLVMKLAHNNQPTMP